MFLLLNRFQNVTRFITSNFSTAHKLLRNHYDSLGITPKATQTDIKAAYYKLSKIYHPDKNKGSEDASRQFQDISAAYEVLGNFKLRKLYDKGLLHTSGHQYATVEPTEVDDHPESKFYKSRRDRHTVPNMSGRTPIYDFDEWSRAHYGSTFERARRAKVRYQEKVAKMERDQIDIKNESVIIGFLSFIMLFLFFSYSTTNDYDTDSLRKNNSRNSK